MAKQETSTGHLGGERREKGIEKNGEKKLANEQSRKESTLPTAPFYMFYILGKMFLGKWFHISTMPFGDECLAPHSSCFQRKWNINFTRR